MPPPAPRAKKLSKTKLPPKAKAKGSAKGKRPLPAWDDVAIDGELIERYKGLPTQLAFRLARSEQTGQLFDLRLKDLVEPRTPRELITGELAEEFNASLPDDVTPLEFHLKVMRFKKLPLSLRASAAKEALPYCHSKNVSTAVAGPDEFARLIKSQLDAMEK